MPNIIRPIVFKFAFKPAKLNIIRYKIIVQTTVGQMKDQGVRVASRCLWDVQTDNYASASYTNVIKNFF